MSTRQDGAPSLPVGSRDDLVGWIAAGCKPKDRWRIGTEHEKLVFATETCRPVPYEGPSGILALMQGLIDRYGWEAIREGDTIIALKRPAGEGSETISLEPGGQFELSGPTPISTRCSMSARTSASASSASASRRSGRWPRPRACPSAAMR